MWRVNIFSVDAYFRNFTECRQCRSNLDLSYLVSLCTFDKQPLVLYDVWNFLTPDSKFQFFVGLFCQFWLLIWSSIVLENTKIITSIVGKSYSWMMGSDAISFKVKTQLHIWVIGGGFHVCPLHRTVCCYGSGKKLFSKQSQGEFISENNSSSTVFIFSCRIPVCPWYFL